MPGDVFTSHAALAELRGWSADECAGTLRIFDRDKTQAYVACDGCEYTAGVPLRELDPALEVARRLAAAEFPERFISRSYAWSAETARVVDALGAWAAEEKLTPTPVLWGRPGRGKTHLVVVTVRDLIARRSLSAWFRSAPRLLSDLQGAFGNDAEYDRIWRRATGVDLLVLDDLGAEMDTDWRADRIAALVDARYNAMLPVLATTNIAPARWGEAFDARTASRLQEMSVPLELVGVDRRVAARPMEGASQ